MSAPTTEAGLSGVVRENAQGTYLDAHVQLWEGTGTPVRVRVRATDADGTERLSVDEEVSWTEVDGCHYQPTRSRL